jgi:hypothetical protein
MRRSALALVIALAAAVVAPAVDPPRVAAAEGYRQTAATVYRLDPANGRLRVTVTLKVTNRTPDRREPYSCIEYTEGWFPIPFPSTCYTTTRFYMTTTSALVENEARAIKATSGGKALAVTAGAPGAAYKAVTVTFPELFFGESRTVKLTYNLRGGEPRSQTATRAMRAFASFCAIANGEDAGTVTIRLPKGFAVTATGEELRSKVVGKERVLSSGRITDPQDWFACFTGTNRSGYRTETIAGHDGRTIRLRSWPEDPAWASGVRADIVSGLPRLERLAGTGITGDASLSVQESATGTEYAGFYDAKTGTITVGEDYGQPALVEHELAHAWFNHGAFKDTWLVEGLAEWAGRTVSDEAPACERPDVSGGSLDLDTWRTLQPQASAEERDQVARQYAVACHVVTAVADAAGEEGMTAAISALLGRRDPYAADPGARRDARVATWKDWLDAVDELALAPAGADSTLASDLLVAVGVAEDATLLADRAAARAAWRNLVAAVDGWVVPAAVREPLAAWRFRDASAAITLARRTWDTTGLTDARLAGVDARHGPAAEAWARATSIADLQDAAVLAERQLAAAQDVAEADALLHAPLDIAQQVGLFGTDVPSLDAAIPAVRAGDGNAVAAITADIRTTVYGLRATGQQRIAAGSVAGAALLALLGAWLVIRGRASARRRALAGPAAVVAVAEAAPVPPARAPLVPDPSAAPDPWVQPLPADDSTRVWSAPVVSADGDPELGALVHAPPRPLDPPHAPGDGHAPGS